MRTRTLFSIALMIVLFWLCALDTVRGRSASNNSGAPVLPGLEQIAILPGSDSIMFTENIGQFDDGARFQMRSSNSIMWLAEDAIWLTVYESQEIDNIKSRKINSTIHVEEKNRRGVNLKISFVGANPHPYLQPFRRADTHVSNFTGDNPQKWYGDIPVWQGVRYVDLYPGIDLEISGENGQIIQRILAHPDANLELVRLQIDGADRVTPNRDTLILTTVVGEIEIPLLRLQNLSSSRFPRAKVSGQRVEWPFASVNTALISAKEYQTSGASDLVFGTFLGGTANDYGSDIAVDTGGNVYVVGSTSSPDFPTTSGTFTTTANNAYVVKFNSAGTGLVYATLIGGSLADTGLEIRVDTFGQAYIAGVTESPDFPTTSDAFDTNYNGGYDAFVVKLSPQGGLAYSTFLGGSSDECRSVWVDGWCALAVDGLGNVFVTGNTSSTDFPTSANAFDTTCGHDGTCYQCVPEVGCRPVADAFAAKINTSGTALEYSTYLGSAWDDCVYAIDVDGFGNAYITGQTKSSGFPTTPNAFDTTSDVMPDAFITKLNPSGSGLIYSTYLGGISIDRGTNITLDNEDNAYVTGNTSSWNFPKSPGAYDTTKNGYGDVFIFKIDTSGANMLYSTLLGGSGEDCTGCSIAVDRDGNAYVAGSTWSPDFPTTPGAFDTTYNNSDVFIAQMNSSGTQLAYSTFLGGSGGDAYPRIGLDLDTNGNAYVVGTTGSPDFPTTPGAFDTVYNYGDAFIVKFALGKYNPSVYTITGRVTDTGNNPITGVVISAGSNLSTTTSATGYYTVTSLASGTYTLTLMKYGYGFSPTLRIINLPPSAVGQNFTGMNMLALTMAVNQFASDSNIRITQVLSEGLASAQDGDYFATQKESDKIKLVADAVVDSAGVLADGFKEVKNVKDLTKMQMPGAIGSLWKHVIKAQELYGEPMRNAFRKFLFTPITDASARTAAKELLQNASICYAANFLDESAETLLTDSAVKLGWQVGLQSELALQRLFYPDLKRLADIFRQDNTSTAASAVLHLPYLTSAEQTIYATDLTKRTQANVIMASTLELRGLPIHLARSWREAEQNAQLKTFLAKYLLKGAAFLAADGAGVLAFELSSALLDLYQNARHLDEDYQMMILGANMQSGAFETQARLWSNTTNGIDNIVKRILPQIAAGNMPSIINVSVGEYKLFGGEWWWERESYSTVAISNTTNHDIAYQVISTYGSSDLLGSGSQMVEEGVATILGSESGVTQVHYKQSDQGGSPDYGSTVYMYLLGSTDTGTYWILNTSTQWQPLHVSPTGQMLQLPSNVDQVTDVTPTLPYPIRSRVDVLGDTLTYLPHLWIANPFTQTIIVTVTQPFPTDIQIIDANGGSLVGQNISWSRAISPQTTIEITHLIAYAGSAGVTLTYPSAQLTMSDQTNVASFTSDPATFQSQPPLSGVGLLPANLFVNQLASVPMTVTNHASVTIAGTIHLKMITLSGIQVYSASQIVNVPATNDLSIVMPLHVPAASNTYILSAIVDSNGGTSEIFDTFIDVIPHKVYLPLTLKNK